MFDEREVLIQPANIPVKLANGKVGYELTKDWQYDWQDPQDYKRSIIVPKGYYNDGASVPRLVWTVSGIIPDGLNSAAATLQDFGCDHEGRLPEGSYFITINGINYPYHNTHHWTREENDRLFGRVLREAEYSEFKRRIAYLSVCAYSKWSGDWK